MIRLIAVVTAYNRADFVAICCKTLCDSASEELEVGIILMDNGSQDETRAIAKSVSDRIHVIRTEDNRHIVEVINRGLRAALAKSPDYVVVMNDDTQFLEGALAKLVEAAEAHPRALLAPMQLAFHRQGHLDAHMLTLVQQTPELVEDAVLGKPLRLVYPQDTIAAAALIARKETWENIGDFDELFWFRGLDDDYCNRAKWLGYEVLLVPASHLYHAHGGLQPQSRPAAPDAVLRKYRFSVQARFLFLLKEPSLSLQAAVFKTFLYALNGATGCAARLWWAGMRENIMIFIDCLRRLPAVEAARKAHFDSAKKIRGN